jgi:glycosyltransferase involved in cell wall biosynthesis
MKILFLIGSLGSGGKERQLVELLKGLNNYPKIECQLVVMNSDIHYEEVFNFDIKINFLIKKIKKDPRILIKLYKICKAFNPDIIHSWSRVTTIYSLLLSKLLRIKFIEGSIRYAAPQEKYRINWFIYKLLFYFSDKIIANSMAGLKTHGLELSNKNICIHNGFDLSRISDISYAKDIKKKFDINTKYVVGIVANFLDSKDHLTLIKAANKIFQERNDMTLLCIGDGPTLKDMIQMIDPKYSGFIKFLGRQTKVESIINIFDIGILTSNTNGHAEGISNSIMENMALSKPVIATDSGGNKELVINNETGYLIKSFDVDELFDRISNLLNNSKKRTDMGSAGNERIRKNFNLEKMINSYLNIYKKVLKND